MWRISKSTTQRSWRNFVCSTANQFCQDFPWLAAIYLIPIAYCFAWLGNWPVCATSLGLPAEASWIPVRGFEDYFVVKIVKHGRFSGILRVYVSWRGGTNLQIHPERPWRHRLALASPSACSLPWAVWSSVCWETGCPKEEARQHFPRWCRAVEFRGSNDLFMRWGPTGFMIEMGLIWVNYGELLYYTNRIQIGIAIYSIV